MPPKGQLDGGERDEGGEDFGEVLEEILGETPFAPEPGKVRSTSGAAGPSSRRKNPAVLFAYIAVGNLD